VFREVAAARTGAAEGGADTILVKDAHDSARNIVLTELPRGYEGIDKKAYRYKN
jgi:D-aminopeptidase